MISTGPLEDAILNPRKRERMVAPAVQPYFPSRSHSRLIQAEVSRGSGGYYDAASSGPDFATQFRSAMPGSANFLINHSERSVTLQRCRREIGNNSYLRGIVDTHVYTVLGRCPRLRVLNDDAEVTVDEARAVEKIFNRWSKKIRLGEKLRQVYEWRKIDGEGIAVFRTNSRLFFPLKLDLRLIDCDQLTSSPYELPLDETQEVDGVIMEDGEPVAYRFLNRHPREIGASGLTPQDFTVVPEQYVVHHFREFRANQRRGISELAPCLLPAAAMRRYTMAVVENAEVAASITALLETDDISEDSVSMNPFQQVPMTHNMALSLPDGYKAKQLKPEQPINTYAQFKREMIAESGRGLGVSANSSMADSSDSSYSAARFDALLEGLGARIERSDFADDVLSKVLWHFGVELLQSEVSLSPITKRRLSSWIFNEGEFLPCEWMFDQSGTVDEKKRSESNDIELKNRSKTLTAVLAERDGTTIEDHLAQLKREQDLFGQYGVEMIDPTQLPSQPSGGSSNVGNDSEDEEGE